MGSSTRWRTARFPELRNHAGRPEGTQVIAAFRKAFHLRD